MDLPDGSRVPVHWASDCARRSPAEIAAAALRKFAPVEVVAAALPPEVPRA